MLPSQVHPCFRPPPLSIPDWIHSVYPKIQDMRLPLSHTISLPIDFRIHILLRNMYPVTISGERFSFSANIDVLLFARVNSKSSFSLVLHKKRPKGFCRCYQKSLISKEKDNERGFWMVYPPGKCSKSFLPIFQTNFSMRAKVGPQTIVSGG